MLNRKVVLVFTLGAAAIAVLAFAYTAVSASPSSVALEVGLVAAVGALAGVVVYVLTKRPIIILTPNPAATAAAATGTTFWTLDSWSPVPYPAPPPGQALLTDDHNTYAMGTSDAFEVELVAGGPPLPVEDLSVTFDTTDGTVELKVTRVNSGSGDELEWFLTRRPTLGPPTGMPLGKKKKFTHRRQWRSDLCGNLVTGSLQLTLVGSLVPVLQKDICRVRFQRK